MKRTGLALLLAASALAMTTACASEGESPGSSADAAATAKPKKATPAMLARGAEIYKANCVTCHGEFGKGDGPGAGVLNPPPRDHTDAAYMNTLTDKDIADVIKMGGAIKGRPLMPSHPQISGNDMDSLVAHIRTLSAPKK